MLTVTTIEELRSLVGQELGGSEFHELTQGQVDEFAEITGDRQCRPFPSRRVHLTSIYSKGDGVVRWEESIVPEADCVQVTGSHIGLVFNRKAYRAIALALAKPELVSSG